MTPTPKLRFVARDSYYKDGEAFMFPHKVRILQQWWVDADSVFDTVTKDIRGEWRDIPLEKEYD